jgi:iron complex transport system substrate-binding protein
LVLRAFFTIIFFSAQIFSPAFASSPQRIVSLGPSITEALYLLGAEDKIVGTTIYCTRPPAARNKEKVGTAIKANLEKIVHLAPDIVLTTSLIGPKDTEKLKNLKIKVVDFPAPRDFSRICEQFLELGRVVAKEKEAQHIVRQAREKVEAIKRRGKALSVRKVFVQIGARPLYAAAKDTFINDLIESAGGENIVSASKNGIYSREKVLQDNPDVIIIATMGLVGEEQKQLWKKYGSIKAVKNNRIYSIDSEKLCSPTPVSFVKALEEIANILHPEGE